jgi:hypothetical protein
VNVIEPPFTVLDTAAIDGPIIGQTQLIDGTVALRLEAGAIISLGLFGPTTSVGTWAIDTNIPGLPKALCRLEITAFAAKAEPVVV